VVFLEVDPESVQRRRGCHAQCRQPCEQRVADRAALVEEGVVEVQEYSTQLHADDRSG
jgi:hypothetical protein